MIKQYNITLRTAKGETLPPYSAYWLYSKLVESVTPEFANYLHKPTYTPLSQYVLRSTYNQEVQWIVNLLEDRAKAEISPILDSWNQFQLERMLEPIIIVKKESKELQKCEFSFEMNRDMKRFYTLHFVSPTSFKSEGEYIILPNTRLIVQSLLNKWKALYPDCILCDDEESKLLVNGIKIRDYKLNSTKYALGGLKLPSFLGYVELQVRLPEQLHHVWNQLYSIAPYTGVGIKTALGMGAVMTKY